MLKQSATSAYNHSPFCIPFIPNRWLATYPYHIAAHAPHTVEGGHTRHRALHGYIHRYPLRGGQLQIHQMHRHPPLPAAPACSGPRETGFTNNRQLHLGAGLVAALALPWHGTALLTHPAAPHPACSEGMSAIHTWPVFGTAGAVYGYCFRIGCFESC